MEKIPFSTIFIPKIFLYGNWSIKSSCYVVKLKFLVKKQFLQQKT
jgi:hypothetical protein